jgi:hypothetical protein
VGNNSQLVLSAARNEFESFQVVIQGGSSGIKGVQAVASKLSGSGEEFPEKNVRLFREALIMAPYASNLEGASGYWPDALVPDKDELVNEKRNAFPFDVPPNENRAIWVELLVPENAKPGKYAGIINLTAADNWSAQVPINLEVWPFTLPSTASLASTFGMGWNTVCQAYGDCSDASIVSNHQQMATFLLDHRLTVDMVLNGPPENGQGYDWENWDQQYAPWFDGTAPTRLKGARQTTIRYQWQKAIGNYAAWAKHFREKGWFDRTFDYTCDEPPATCAWSDISNRSQAIHSADADFQTLVTTSVDDARSHGVLQDIRIIVPVINFMDGKPGNYSAGNQRARYDEFISQGGKLFWYQSCMSQGCGGNGPKSYDQYSTGWPNMMIDASAIRNRAMEWLSFLYRIQGELYWETTFAYNFGNDPWVNQWYFAGNGDGNLVYPGTPNKIGGTTPVPVSSIRLKMIREGMEDYEYLKLVSDLGDPEFARQQASLVAQNTYTITGDPQVVYLARAALAKRIAELMPTPEQPDKPNANPAQEPSNEEKENELPNSGSSDSTNEQVPSSPSELPKKGEVPAKLPVSCSAGAENLPLAGLSLGCIALLRKTKRN